MHDPDRAHRAGHPARRHSDRAPHRQTHPSLKSFGFSGKALAVKAYRPQKTTSKISQKGEITMKIAEVSKLLDISADTLRYYERIGLIPKIHRDKSGNRDYTELNCKWIKFI